MTLLTKLAGDSGSESLSRAAGLHWQMVCRGGWPPARRLATLACNSDRAPSVSHGHGPSPGPPRRPHWQAGPRRPGPTRRRPGGPALTV